MIGLGLEASMVKEDMVKMIMMMIIIIAINIEKETTIVSVSQHETND